MMSKLIGIAIVVMACLHAPNTSASMIGGWRVADTNDVVTITHDDGHSITGFLYTGVMHFLHGTYRNDHSTIDVKVHRIDANGCVATSVGYYEMSDTDVVRAHYLYPGFGGACGVSASAGNQYLTREHSNETRPSSLVGQFSILGVGYPLVITKDDGRTISGYANSGIMHFISGYYTEKDKVEVVVERWDNHGCKATTSGTITLYGRSYVEAYYPYPNFGGVCGTPREEVRQAWIRR